MRHMTRNNPYFTTNYITTTDTAKYLESLPRELEIPTDFLLVVRVQFHRS